MGSKKLEGNGEYGIEVGGWKGMGSRVWKWEVGWGVGNGMKQGIEVGGDGKYEKVMGDWKEKGSREWK